MRAGDSGHILLSEHVADVLVRLSDWAPRVHDLGVYALGGARFRVYNLVAQTVGNMERPTALRTNHATVGPRAAGRMVTRLFDEGEPTVTACLEDARVHFVEGRFHEAVLRFTEAIRLKPDCPDAYAGRARAYSALGRNGEAVEDYDEAISLQPRVAQFYLLRASVRDAIGEPAAALTDLNEALRLDPCSADAYCQRAGLVIRSGDLLSAIEDCTEAIRLRPDDAAAYRWRAQAYAGLSRMAESRQDREEADRMGA